MSTIEGRTVCAFPNAQGLSEVRIRDARTKRVTRVGYVQEYGVKRFQAQTLNRKPVGEKFHRGKRAAAEAVRHAWELTDE